MKLSRQETIKGLAEVIYANQEEAGEFLSSTSRLDDINLEDLIILDKYTFKMCIKLKF